MLGRLKSASSALAISRRAFVAGAGVVAGIAATGLPARRARAQAGAATLRIGQLTLGGENMDPAVEVRTPALNIHMMLYDCIVEIGPNNEVIPGIAESWSTDESGTVWTFKIRQGVQFHGGYGEVTSEDVVYSLDRYLAPDAKTSGRGTIVAAIESAVALDPYTVEIRTKGRVSGLLQLLSPHQVGTGVVYCKKYMLEEGGPTFEEQTALMNQRPIGSGPYEFEGRVRGQSMTFRAIENHWRVSPQVRRVEWLLIPDPSTQLFMLQSGELDMVELDADRAGQIQDAEGIAIYSIRNGIDFGLNVYATYSETAKSLPTSDVRVRHALSKAIDRKTIIETLMRGYAQLPQVSWGVAASADGIDIEDHKEWAEDLATYDPEGARALLAEAGYPDGFGGVKILMAQPNGGLPNMVEVTLAVAAQWAKVGVDVEIAPMEYTNLRPYLVGDQEDPFIGGQIVPFSNQPRLTAENFLSIFFKYVGGAPNHSQLLKSEELNALMAEMKETIDPDARNEVGKKAFGIVRDSWVSLHVLTADAVYGVNSDLVANWAPTPDYAFLARQIERMELVA